MEARAYDRAPLPDLDGDGVWVAHLDLLGRATTADLLATQRVACLSESGVNMLQQYLTFDLTRAAVPTEKLNEAFAQT